MNFTKSLAYSTALCAVGMLAANAAVAAEKPKLKISGYQETYFGVADVTTGTTVVGHADLHRRHRRRRLHPAAVRRDPLQGHRHDRQRHEVGRLLRERPGRCVRHRQEGQGRLGRSQPLPAGLLGQDGDRRPGRRVGQDAGQRQRASTWSARNILGAYVRDRGDSLRGSEDDDNNVDSSDDSKFTYYTPRVSGFQAGVSYIPSLGTKGSVPGGSTSGGIESGVELQGQGRLDQVRGGRRLLPGRQDRGRQDHRRLGPRRHGRLRRDHRRARATPTTTTGAPTSSDQKAWTSAPTTTAASGKSRSSTSQSKLNFDAGGANDKYHQTALQGAYNLGGGLTAALGLYTLQDGRQDLDQRQQGQRGDRQDQRQVLITVLVPLLGGRLDYLWPATSLMGGPGFRYTTA